MEILVLSDSHGKVDHMVRAVEQFHPRQVLHLGDCVRDAQALERQFPQLPVTMVPGNCDWGQTGEPATSSPPPWPPSTPPGSTGPMCCCSATPTSLWWTTTAPCG